MTDVSAQSMGDASRAYAAYGAAVGWRTHDGRKMPPWFDLGPSVQAGWAAVGKLIRDDVSRETSVAPPLVACLIDEFDPGDESRGAYIDPVRLAEIVQGLKEEYGYGS